jgi:hypothetical protein
MTKDKIQQLADFFYSSNDSNNVPLRLAITTGIYSGFDLQKDKFIKLFTILNNSKNLKKDLMNFRRELEYEE